MKQLGEVLKLATDFLKERGIADPRRSSEELLAAVLGVKRIDLYLKFDQPLEEKVRSLVALIDTLRAERAQAVEEAGRLAHELEAATARLAESAGAAADAATLREERELIRSRVVQMISQIEKLTL